MSDAEELTTYTLTGTRQSPRRTRIETDDAAFVIGDDASPVESLLGSLFACVSATGSYVAHQMDLELEALTGTIEGDIDYAAFRGEADAARAGFQDVRITLDVEADADEEALETWLAAVEERCPVSDTVKHGTSVGIDLERA